MVFVSTNIPTCRYVYSMLFKDEITMGVDKMAENKPKEVRHREILDAALQCFTEKGRHKTTIDDIASEANMTKGGIYWHYRDKREIYISMIERHLQEDMAIWNELLTKEEIGPDLITNVGISYLRYFIRDRRHIYLHAEFFAESFRDDVLKAELDKVHRKWKMMIKNIVQKVLEKLEIEQPFKDVDGISCVLLACIEGIAHQYWLSGKDEDVTYYEKAWRVFVNLLLKGVQAK